MQITGRIRLNFCSIFQLKKIQDSQIDPILRCLIYVSSLASHGLECLIHVSSFVSHVVYVSHPACHDSLFAEFGRLVFSFRELKL